MRSRVRLLSSPQNRREEQTREEDQTEVGGLMGYSARVLADSISPAGNRLTTIEATFPRPYLAEFNTHRMFSRNSASSRAIPPEQNIENVRRHPYVPETFGARVKGMGYGIDLDPHKADAARDQWLFACEDAIGRALELNEIGIDKSRVNRLLEPFMWHTVIVTATDWDNFWYLRQPMTGDVPNPEHGAQPEMQIIARMMRDAYTASHPEPISQGWHTPLVELDEWIDHSIPIGLQWEGPKRVSTRRVARVSFDKHTDSEPWGDSIKKAGDLLEFFHLSPTEHVARPFTDDEHNAIRDAQIMIANHHRLDRVISDHMIRELEYIGNFRGWVQFRKEIPWEHDALKATHERGVMDDMSKFAMESAKRNVSR